MSWPQAKLEDLIQQKKGALVSGPFGSSISAKFFVDEGVPVIRGNNLSKDEQKFIDKGFAYLTESKAAEFSNCIATEGDIIFTAAGSIGQVGIIPEDRKYSHYIISNKQLRARIDREKAFPLFVYYWLSSKKMVNWLEGMNNGGAVPLLNLGIVKKAPIPFPPRRIQAKICDILSSYDDLIENNRRRIQLLEQAARLLYKEWFVHLRFPGHEHVKVTDGVPESWKRTTLGKFIDDGSISLQTGPFGTQLKASDYTEDGIPVINVRNIGYGDIRPEKLEFLPESKVMSLSKHILQTGDIVFGRKGAVDRHVLIGPNQDGWMQGSDCIRMRITGNGITPNLVSVAFREDGHKQWMLGQCGNKATMASLNQDVISRIPVLVPSHEVLLLFEEFASRIFSQIATLARQSEVAASARDLLLPRLMNGEVKV